VTKKDKHKTIANLQFLSAHNNHVLQPCITITRGGYRLCESCDFTRSNSLIYIKSENIVRKLGKIEKNINKIR